MAKFWDRVRLLCSTKKCLKNQHWLTIFELERRHVPTERAQKITEVSDPGELKLAWGSISQDGRMFADCLDRISVSRSKQEANLANLKRILYKSTRNHNYSKLAFKPNDCQEPKRETRTPQQTLTKMKEIETEENTKQQTPMETVTKTADGAQERRRTSKAAGSRYLYANGNEMVPC